MSDKIFTANFIKNKFFKLLENNFEDSVFEESSLPDAEKGLIDCYKALAGDNYPQGPEDDGFINEAEYFIGHAPLWGKDREKLEIPYTKKQPGKEDPMPRGVVVDSFMEKVVYLPPKSERQICDSVIFPLPCGLAQKYGYKDSRYLPMSITKDRRTSDNIDKDPEVADYYTIDRKFIDSRFENETFGDYKGLIPNSTQLNNLISYNESWKEKFIDDDFDLICKYTSIEVNPTLSDDGFELEYISNDIKSVRFAVEFEVSEADYYNLSSYFRNPLSGSTEFRGLCFYKNDDPIEANYVYNPALKIDNFIVFSEWNRFGCISYLEPGTYKIAFVWLPKVKGEKIRVAGILVHKGSMIPPYDIRYMNKPIKYSPILINLEQIKHDNNSILTTHDWSIIYRKNIRDNVKVNNTHIDSLGKYYWGLKNGKLVIGYPVVNSIEEKIIDTDINLQNFCNNLEIVLLEYNHSNNEITITYILGIDENIDRGYSRLDPPSIKLTQPDGSVAESDNDILRVETYDMNAKEAVVYVSESGKEEYQEVASKEYSREPYEIITCKIHNIDRSKLTLELDEEGVQSKIKYNLNLGGKDIYNLSSDVYYNLEFIPSLIPNKDRLVTDTLCISLTDKELNGEDLGRLVLRSSRIEVGEIE